MQRFLKFILLVSILSAVSGNVSAQATKGLLRLVSDSTKDRCGYVNGRGDTVIPFGKYWMCYTKKFDQLAIVWSEDKGLIGIDKNENILFKVYVFDNGPDYPSNGLFRIVKDGKIGYANLKGQIVIQPRFDCAYPFKNGKAEVGEGCETQTDGEHSWWTGGNWYTINKKGRLLRR